MRIRTRIIGASMLVVIVLNVLYAVYFLGQERKRSIDGLQATIQENERLLKVVTAGPLYDGNVERLNTDLDSFFLNPNLIRIALQEYKGDIRITRQRTPHSTVGEELTSRVVITRGMDELGEIHSVYSTVLIEEQLLRSRNQLILMSAILIAVLSGVIYLVARGLTGPIDRLTMAARAMADGNLGQEISTSGAEELHSLAQSFIRMRDAIRAKMADLAAQNEAMRLKDMAMASSINGIAIASPDGLLTYVNSSFLRLWGYDDASQVLGESVLSFWQSEEKAREVLETVMTRGGGFGEMIAKRKDGSLFSVAYAASQVRDEAGRITHVMGSFVDITDRKRAEAALKESEERLSLALAASNQGLYDLNVQTGETKVNRQYAMMLGYDPGEFQETNARWVERLHPDDREAVAETYRAYIRGEVPIYAVEFRQRTKSGDWKWILSLGSIVARDAEGKPLRMLGTHTDITERKRAEDAVRNEKAFSDAIVESLPGIFYICDEEGNLLRWNTNEREVTGYSMEELSRMNLLLLFREDRDIVRNKLREVMETGRTFIEASIVTKSGIPLPFYLTGCRMIRDGKKYVVGVGIDVSEKKRLEQQLQQAQKMEAIGQLAGGVAHDFNNILSAIIGYGSIIQMKMEDNDPLRSNVDHLLESAERAAQLTHSLLAFSRKQVMNMKPVSLNDIIARQGKFLRRIIGEDIEMKTILHDDPVVMADTGQIEQVFMNLATNARDAMPKGGQLTFEMKVQDMTEEFVSVHGYGESGHYAVISVGDTGIGIDEETRKKIFEPFFTTKEVGRGTGLGLSMVYGIIKQHKGYITVNSQTGRGTTFNIYLPLYTGQTEQRESMTAAPPMMTGTETLLLAEDDATLRNFFHDVLTECGYTVIVAENGEDAVNKFMVQKDSIQLCILDMIMPKKSGKEVFEAVRRIKPGTKVIFSSGYTADKVQREGLPAGSEFIEKPAPPQVLLKKIREILDRQGSER
jgi:two-component system cell cycle sensor histidine kinase/response regulator CckA